MRAGYVIRRAYYRLTVRVMEHPVASLTGATITQATSCRSSYLFPVLVSALRTLAVSARPVWQKIRTVYSRPRLISDHIRQALSVGALR